MYVHVHVAQTGNENVSFKFHSDPLTLLIKTFESIFNQKPSDKKNMIVQQYVITNLFNFHNGAEFDPS